MSYRSGFSNENENENDDDCVHKMMIMLLEMYVLLKMMMILLKMMIILLKMPESVGDPVPTRRGRSREYTNDEFCI